MTDQNQRKTYEEWLEEYKGIFFKIVRSFSNSQADQDDLFQEISINVWKSVPKFKSASAVSTWIYRIALNTAITWSTREKRHEDKKQDQELRKHILEPAENKMDEQVAWLYKEINKLDEIDRSIALLMFDDLSYNEIAEILGITKSNVGVKIHRIKKYLIAQSEKYQHHGI